MKFINPFVCIVDCIGYIFRSYIPPKKYDDICIREQFLWLPLIINGEIKWLKRAKWEQITTDECLTFGAGYFLVWKNNRWID